MDPWPGQEDGPPGASRSLTHALGVVVVRRPEDVAEALRVVDCRPYLERWGETRSLPWNE